MMSPDSPYFSLIVSYVPKWFLLAIIVVVLAMRWRQVGLDGAARTMAWTGLGLFAFVLVASPLLYGWLQWRMLNHGMAMQATGHALIGGALTIAEFAGIVLLGLAVAAGRGERR